MMKMSHGPACTKRDVDSSPPHARKPRRRKTHLYKVGAHFALQPVSDLIGRRSRGQRPDGVLDEQAQRLRQRRLRKEERLVHASASVVEVGQDESGGGMTHGEEET